MLRGAIFNKNWYLISELNACGITRLAQVWLFLTIVPKSCCLGSVNYYNYGPLYVNWSLKHIIELG